MANFGMEGDTYTMVDGKPVFTDKVLHGEEPPVNIIRETGAQSNFGFWQDYDYELQWTTPVAVEGIEMYTENDVFMDKFPTLKFTKEEQDTIAKLLPKVETYMGEVRQQWILGAKPVDFEAYHAEMEKMGARIGSRLPDCL